MRKNSKTILIVSVSFLMLSIFASKTMQAQDADTLLFRTVGEEKAKRKIFSIRTVTHVGFVLPPKDNTQYRIKYGNSVQGMFGVQLQAKLAKWYKMGADLLLTGNHYAIWQDEGKLFVDMNQNRKESFRNGELSLAFTHQFKLNKGITQRWAIEASIYGAYVYSASRKTLNVDHNPDNIYSGKTRTRIVERHLSYVERWQWGLRAGLTYRTFGIYAQYRMSNLVKLGTPAHYDAFDLPKFSLGISFSGDLKKF